MILDQIGSALSLGLNVTLISDIFRALFFFIDGLIYSFIPTVYSLIYSLYDFSSIFGEGVLNNVVSNMTSTVYSFLAIFMFFRVAFSLITMLVDPSVIDDKERGAKKVVMNIMICLILIVAVPYAFRYAKMIQTRVIDNHLIEQIVAGRSFNDSSYDLGNEMALSVWSVFLRPADGSGDPAVSAYNSVFNSGSSDWNLSAILDEINNVSGGSLSGIFGRYHGDTHYCLSYVYILSTIAGAYVLWMFIKVMIDVAYRSIKFFVLELLSPIAIVSYIDPSSSKKGIFSKWLNETVKTYVGLFVRIFVFALAAVLLRTFSMSDLSSGNGLFVNLFYILAIIAFIKNGPGFIDNLFGTSISKDSDTKFAKNMLSGLAGGAVGLAAGGISNAVVAKRVGKNAIKAGFAGGYSGMKKGYSAGKKGGFGALSGVASNAYGSYGDAKKKYGYEYDKELEKLINSLQQRVPDVNTAKGAAANAMQIGGEGFNQKLAQGAKVNGRKYGMGLENDEGLENLLKKNAGGLAQDELLHQGDQRYLELRRAVRKAKDDEAILSRVNSKARSQYSSAESAYNSADDKSSYVVSFEMGTAQMDYGRMDDKALKESYTKELEKSATNFVQNERQRFDLSSREQKVNLVLNSSNMDRVVVEGMSDVDLSSEYQRIINEAAQNQVSSKAFSFTAAATQEDKVKVALDLKQRNIEYEVSSLNAAELTDRFDKANEERIVATFGQSITNIDADAGKASGDAKKAQEALDNYLKSGDGKKAKNIDSAYSIADSRQKAKELEEKRKKEQQQNNS